MFWVHPERTIYGNIDITLKRHLPHCSPTSLPVTARLLINLIRGIKNVFMARNMSGDNLHAPDEGFNLLLNQSLIVKGSNSVDEG